MKHKNYLIILLFLVPCLTYAQGKATEERRITPAPEILKTKRFEVGFNTTPLIKQVFNLSGNNLPQSIYDYTFRYYFKQGKMAYRFGTGITYREDKDVDITSGGATGSETRFKNELYAFRNGVEWIKPLGKRLNAHLGADLIYTYRNNGSSNSFNELSDKTTEIGGGPILGLTFNVYKNFSIYTETSMYLAQAKTKTVNERKQGFPAPNKTTTEGTSKTLTSTLPTTLYLTFRF